MVCFDQWLAALQQAGMQQRGEVETEHNQQDYPAFVARCANLPDTIRLSYVPCRQTGTTLCDVAIVGIVSADMEIRGWFPNMFAVAFLMTSRLTWVHPCITAI